MPHRAEDTERRRNTFLRTMVDDLLAQVRDAQRHVGPWTQEERAQAEAALDRIMQQVRGEAFRRRAD
jgi:hypothetical protein